MNPNRQNQLSPDDVALLGVPSDENSSYLRGAALAPAAIREALHSPSANLWSEQGIDLGNEPRWHDLGDLALSPGAAGFDQITTGVGELLDQDLRPLALGGDHAATFPLVRAFAQKYPNLTLLHVDAHPDLYDDFEGNPYSHASPFARIMEAGLAIRLVQVGIRTLNGHQRAQAARFGVEIVEMRHHDPGIVQTLQGPLYLSLDLDALDPAFAPGVSHHEPGGFSTRQVLDLIQRIDVPLVGADLVELNPTRDIQNVTAMAAAKFVREIVAVMLRT
jgi:arginase